MISLLPSYPCPPIVPFSRLKRTNIVRFPASVTDNYRRSSFNSRFFPGNSPRVTLNRLSENNYARDTYYARHGTLLRRSDSRWESRFGRFAGLTKSACSRRSLTRKLLQISIIAFSFSAENGNVERKDAQSISLCCAVYCAVCLLLALAMLRKKFAAIRKFKENWTWNAFRRMIDLYDFFFNTGLIYIRMISFHFFSHMFGYILIDSFC